MLPSDWKTKNISDILERVSFPVNVETDKEYREIGIRSHAKGVFYKKSIKGKTLGNKRVFHIKPNCFVVNIVFAWEQAVAKTTDNEVGMIASHRFPMYKPKNNECDIDYILALFKTKLGKHLLGLASPGGAGRNKTLGQAEFARLKILIPPIVEQKIIMKIISTWDKAINITEKLIETDKIQKKALIQQLLTGKKKLPHYESSKWSSMKLDNICSFLKGYGLSKGKLSTNGKYKCILYGELYTKYGEVIKDVKSRTNIIEGRPSVSGDILIPASTTTTGVDLANATSLKFDDVLLSGDINILRPDTSRVNSDVLAHILTHIKKRELARFAQGITIIHLYGKDIKSITVKVPLKMDEQNALAKILATIEQQIKAQESDLVKLKKEKESLIQQLLTGKTRVKTTEAA